MLLGTNFPRQSKKLSHAALWLKEVIRKYQSYDKTEPPAKPAKDTVTQMTFSLVLEQKEKEKHQLNIIMHNLEKSSASNGPTKKQEDIKKCRSVFEIYLGASVIITSAFCLG